MQRRHYYDQSQQPPESIPLDEPYGNPNRGPSPVYYPDQAQHSQSQGYHDSPHYNQQQQQQHPHDNQYHASDHARGGGDPYYQGNYHAQPDPYAQGHGGYHARSQNSHAPSNITPGADNFSDGAAGGVAGIAYSVAETHARDSNAPAEHHQQQPMRPGQAYATGGPYAAAAAATGGLHSNHSSGSNPNPFAGGSDGSSRSSMAGPGYGAPGGDPYQNYSRPTIPPQLGVVDPDSIADDGDDGLNGFSARPARHSALSLHSNRSNGRNGHGAAAIAGAGAMGAVAAGGMAADNLSPSNRNSIYRDAGAAGAGVGAGAGAKSRAADILAEKESAWLAKQRGGKKRWKWAIIIGVIIIIIGAIVGGLVGGLLNRSNGGSGDRQHGQTAEEDEAANGDLGINSAEIKALMGNSKLHKVFPGIDYTPINTQYPDCEKWPPSQNNVTRDLAVLSQITDTVRLYGTDCNQTQMVLHAIDRLELKGKMKVWLGVWQDGNSTTNERQLDQMWDLLEEYHENDYFAGVIVANEILFRQEMTVTELGTLLDNVRKELKERGFNLPVATSDLGDDLTQDLVDVSDYVMANIHPFFAGVDASKAAGWTWSFWENQNGDLWKPQKERNVIAEVGWPSQGGQLCGNGQTSGCDEPAIAGIEEMNKVMDGWVCEALKNGTNYFWFSAFDEPWKVRFAEDGKEWEDHWGLFDVNRNLKPGLVIPDCDGKTI